MKMTIPTMIKLATWHFLKNLFLLSLSLLFLPIDTTVITAITIWNRVRLSHPIAQDDTPAPSPDQKKTVLVTGMSMSKGLVLARLFHRRGHRVIGADTHHLAMGRVSAALDKFYLLPKGSDTENTSTENVEDEDDPYVLRLLEVVKQEDVDLWISVSDVNATRKDAVAKDVIETQTKAKALQFNLKDVMNLHEKDAFMEHTRYLGLPVPDSQVVTSKNAVIEFLHRRGGLTLDEEGKGTQYILKPIGVDDIARNDMVLLPLATEQDTLRRLDAVPAFVATSSREKPSVLIQEFIRGQEFCTHALVVKGQVRAFTACPSSGVLMHYTALPEDAPLCRAMLAFTRIMATAGGSAWTGHVSFDFLVKGRRGALSPSSLPGEKDGEVGDGEEEEEDVRIFPIECNPRVHTAIVLFNDTPRLVDEYLSILDQTRERTSGGGGDDPIFPKGPLKQYYWVGQDLIERVIYPLYQHLFSGTVNRSQLGESVGEFVHHLQHWKDGTFEVWDPWPWWWLYHVYWPVRFLGFLFRGRWNLLNVSTGKAFKAK